MPGKVAAKDGSARGKRKYWDRTVLGWRGGWIMRNQACLDHCWKDRKRRDEKQVVSAYVGAGVPGGTLRCSWVRVDEKGPQCSTIWTMMIVSTASHVTEMGS